MRSATQGPPGEILVAFLFVLVVVAVFLGAAIHRDADGFGFPLYVSRGIGMEGGSSAEEVDASWTARIFRFST